MISHEIETQGYCVVNMGLSQEFIDSSINEIVCHLESQPRAAGYEIKIPRRALSKKEVKQLKERWVPYMTFGAVSEPPAYHLNHAWAYRQDPVVVDVFSEILDTSLLSVSIDRYKAKLPGCGEREFLHWDWNPLLSIQPDYKHNLQVQGILALTDLTFFCTPGSNKQEFIDWFINSHPSVKYGNITTIEKKQDIYRIGDSEIAVHVPAGCHLIWDNKLLHSSYPNNTDELKYAFYVTYHRKHECFQTKEDRLRSYTTGLSPKLQPSGRVMNYMPTIWTRYPKQAYEYHKRLPEELREFRIGSNAKEYPIIVERTPDYYVPPSLSELGKSLL